MRITEEQIIYIFLLGTAAGSAITYFAVTREKRIISSVRKDIRHLSDIHELTSDEWRKAESKEIASDQRILELHRWATEECRRLKKQKIRISAPSLTAESIICEEFFELDRFDALGLLIKVRGKYGSLDELRTLTGTLLSKKSKGKQREEQRRIYEENYKREGEALKRRVIEELKAISHRESRRFTTEGVQAAKALQERHGNHPDTLGSGPIKVLADQMIG